MILDRTTKYFKEKFFNQDNYRKMFLNKLVSVEIENPNELTQKYALIFGTNKSAQIKVSFEVK
jgi:hypothetical protein